MRLARAPTPARVRAVPSGRPSRRCSTARATTRDEDEDARAGRRRDALALGDVVEIRVLGAARDASASAVGTIGDFVTNASFHEEGIKVRLTSGEIGRVRRRLDADADETDADETDTDEDEGEEEEEEDISGELNERASSSDGSSSSSGGRAVRTAHVSSVSKSADAATAKQLAAGLPGVRKVKMPVRGGSHMGYMFVECEDAAALANVVAALNGLEFEGKRLVVEPAKEDPRSKSKPKTKKATSAIASTKKEKAAPKKTRAELEAEAAERRILEARAQMEADALLELERAKRRRERELELRDRELQAQRELELERERRAKATLERRAAAAKARADKARLAAEAREARLAAAARLGDVRVDDSWRARSEELRAALNRLRVDVD